MSDTLILHVCTCMHNMYNILYVVYLSLYAVSLYSNAHDIVLWCSSLWCVLLWVLLPLPSPHIQDWWVLNTLLYMPLQLYGDFS